MRVLRNIIMAVLVLGVSSCMSVSDTPLEISTYDMGPTASYYVHPYKIKLLDIDQDVLTFDVVSVVELTNQSSKQVSYDVTCTFKKGHDILKTKTLEDLRVSKEKNRRIRMVYTARDHSVKGYHAKCRVKLYR